MPQKISREKSIINWVVVMVGSQERDTEGVTPNSILKLKRPCHIEGEVEGSVREEILRHGKNM